VDGGLARARRPDAAVRLIVDFARHVPAERVAPQLVTGILLSEGSVETCDVPYQEPGAVASAIGELVTWATTSGADVAHIDVLLPIELFREARPEHAQCTVRQFKQYVIRKRSLAMRWSDRLHEPNLDKMILLALSIAAREDEPVSWVDPG